jgi:small subunit ribosomal protein S17
MKNKAKQEEKIECNDIQCPTHGHLKARGRTFEGDVIKKFPRRIVIEFERTIYIKKYERYAKKKTTLHARTPKCMESQVKVGDYVLIKECRPLSKIIHFVLIKVIRNGDRKK